VWIAAGLCLSLLAVPIAEEHQFVLLGIPTAATPRTRRRIGHGGRGCC
jgi:hypothetical protein